MTGPDRLAAAWVRRSVGPMIVQFGGGAAGALKARRLVEGECLPSRAVEGLA